MGKAKIIKLKKENWYNIKIFINLVFVIPQYEFSVKLKEK
jgi:hypothetical protein